MEKKNDAENYSLRSLIQEGIKLRQHVQEAGISWNDFLLVLHDEEMLDNHDRLLRK